jgi:hypothetical protein
VTNHQELCALYESIINSNANYKSAVIDLVQRIRRGLIDYLCCDSGHLFFADITAEQKTKFAQLESTISFDENACFWQCWLCIKLLKGDTPPLYLMISIGVKKTTESEYIVSIADREFDISINDETTIASLYPEVAELIADWLRTKDKAACLVPIPTELMFGIYGK